jgi:hypothetical protein
MDLDQAGPRTFTVKVRHEPAAMKSRWATTSIARNLQRMGAPSDLVRGVEASAMGDLLKAIWPCSRMKRIPSFRME